MYSELNYGIECLQQEMDYIMEETGDIDGGIKFEESEDYVLHSVNDDQIVS